MNQQQLEANACIIALAFPDCFIEPDQGWYMSLLDKLGIAQDNGKVPGGHSCLLLVDKRTGGLYYADFGRYGTAKGKGRARALETDPELVMERTAVFDDEGNITNLDDILLYMSSISLKTRGKNTMFASINDEVNYERALSFIHGRILQGSVPYISWSDGSNCARFTADVVAHASLNIKTRLRFKFNFFIDSPVSNVFNNRTRSKIFKVLDGKIEEETSLMIPTIARYFLFNKITDKNGKGTVVRHFKEPNRDGIARNAQWLGSVGYGAWFELKKTADLAENQFRVIMVSEQKDLVFNEIFELNKSGFDPSQSYEFTYDCTALFCTIMQGKQIYRLERELVPAAVVASAFPRFAFSS